jgi:hypothetical protein
VEFVEDDTDIGDVAGDGVAKRFPHVHHGHVQCGRYFSTPDP